MSNTTCPFDQDFCPTKQEYVKDWELSMIQEYGMCFEPMDNLFPDCPKCDLEREKDCRRYQRYLAIVANVTKSMDPKIKQ